MPEEFYTYYQSPLGLLKIAGTENFITEILFIDNIEKPHIDHKKKIPPIIINCIEQLIQYFQSQRKSFDFPMNQTGTAFQKKVWNELLSIPFGKTISYQELSRRLGDTRAIRAAAAANGKNNIVIVVPCHRVIGSKNDLVGYSGGVWRKKWLLDHEAKIAYGVQTLF
ncbi:MAG: methylated-DNA--[protein]-cysteine S-methyltransferase [Bacteroidetes bacterium]|nr:methylated-DNA--[protein]-cysteine S-methyltransferase [Bacteroidota bacterium]MBS1975401.1 methylated-DNA--[protein]-cysteine S-methyltransferase [Bacteroidota bacterium]